MTNPHIHRSQMKLCKQKRMQAVYTITTQSTSLRAKIYKQDRLHHLFLIGK